MRDLPNLDFMRSFAVLLVVASHLLLYTGHIDVGPFSFWLAGSLGVFIFFTHTTLVLMWSLERDPHPLRFYVRRAFRIYPLWLVVLFATIAVQLPLAPIYAPVFRYFHAGAPEVLANATLTFSVMKFGSRIVGPAWSLPIEVEMYILLPVLFFFLRSYRKLWPLLLLDLLAMANSVHEEGLTASTLLFCVPLFLPGAMAYLGYKHRRPVLPAWLFPVLLVAAAAACNAYASRQRISFRSGWFFTLLLGLGLPFFRQLSWRPLCRAAHLVARYSYGVYLCHSAAIVLAVYTLRGHSIALRALVFVAALTGLSVLAYHAVEKPLIVLGSRLAKRLESGPEPPMNEANLSIEPAP